VGVLAAPGPAYALAEELARDLPDLLRARFPGFTWEVRVRQEPLAGPAGNDEELIRKARRRLLDEGWKMVVCLTDLPLHVGRRPVTAHASVALGVGLVSVPALGVVDIEEDLRQAVLRIIEGLLGESVRDAEEARRDRGRRARMRERLKELTSPVGRADVTEDRSVRFVTAVTRGNLRLLAGMVRANRPWGLIVGLSRSLVASLSTAAFALTSPGIWRIADGMGSGRLLVVALGSILAICVSLVLAHDLWERRPADDVRQEVRERVILFNLTTLLTVLIGVLTIYLALFVIVIVIGPTLITPKVLQGELRHPVGLGHYASLAWLATSMAMVGGALGAALEEDAAVREAAYGYRPDERIEADRE
jgi:hypothetical protein